MTKDKANESEDAESNEEPQEAKVITDSSNPAKSKVSVRTLKIVAAVLAAVMLIGGGVLYWQSYVGPQRNAQSILDNLGKNTGAIEALNTDMVTFTGQSVKGANTSQKALAQGSTETIPPAFIFGNGKKNSERKVVNYYLDFSDQRSRDALIANSLTLKSMVESGSIELRVHPLLGGRAYSAYAAEALSEVFAADSEKAWPSLMALLRESAALAGLDDVDVMADRITESLNRVGVTSVNRESIQNGTFSSWTLSVGNDPALSDPKGLTLPYILVNGKSLDLSVEQLNDTAAFRKAILRELK